MKEKLKERFEKTKEFVKEYKFEILGCGLLAASSIVGVKLLKEYSDIKAVEEEERRLYIKGYNNATDIANNVLIPEINGKWEGIDFSNFDTDPEHARLYDEYNREYETRWNEVLKDELDKVGL